jgi:hypothetical protein
MTQGIPYRASPLAVATSTENGLILQDRQQTRM